MTRLISYIKSQNFYPGFLGLFINPFFFARSALVRHIKSCSPELGGRLLDVGCGKKPYKKLFVNVTEYIGMDIDNPGHDHSNEDIDIFYDGKRFPFADSSFDSVLTNQVFEHVFNPVEFMSEVNRVLKPGGHLLLTVPFMWDEHEQPFDFGRYSSFGIKHILVNNGMEILKQYKSCAGVTAVIQLFILSLYKGFYSKNRSVNLILTVILISPFAVFGKILSVLSNKESDMFLDNVVLARKLK